VDPNRRIKGVKVLVAPRMARRGDGSWPPLPGTRPVDLKVDGSVATGEVKVALGEVKVALGQSGAAARSVLIQTVHIDSTGKLLHSRPRRYFLVNQDGKIVGRGKIEELRRKLAWRSLRRLGPLLEDDDPQTDDEC
jgi:hypothetical protein